MFISTAKYLEEIRKAEERGYQKGMDTIHERCWHENQERHFHDCLKDIHKDICELRGKVDRLTGEVPKKWKGERPVKGRAKVIPVIIRMMKMADEMAKEEQSEEPCEAPECEAECAEKEPCTVETE